MSTEKLASGRRALLIGINTYPYLSARYQLKGCLNDVNLVSQVLRDHYGFPDPSLTVLCDEQATRAKILFALDALAREVADNDIVLIYYSGHGSQMVDREGDEPDGLDETIVAHDSGRGTHPNNDITDDEIYIRLHAIAQKTPYITLIFDCCHSGHITRDAFGAGERWVEPDGRLDQLPPPCELPHELKSELQATTRDLSPSGWFPLGERHVLIAGCRSEESSYEHQVEDSGQTTHGALTYFLCRELVKAESGSTYRDIFEMASTQVTSIFPRQHPQLEGSLDREVLGVRDIRPMRFVQIRERKGDRVVLGAGAAHGVSRGSRWAIYSEGTKQFTDGGSRLGSVEIDRVASVTCEAVICEEGGSIRAGARAVEEAHCYGEMRLSIDIQAPLPFTFAADQLRAVVESRPLLRLADNDQMADIRLYALDARTQAKAEDPVPQLRSLKEPCWAAVGRDGRLNAPLQRIGDTEQEQRDAVDVLRENLEKLARYRLTLTLTNPSPGNPLRGRQKVLLEREGDDGTFAPAQAEAAGGKIVFESGQRVRLTIKNDYDRDVYVSIFDFGLSGAVTMLYPWRGSSERIIQGNSVSIGPFELYFPDSYPLFQASEGPAPGGGIETFKIFITVVDTDFSRFTQDSFRSGMKAMPDGREPSTPMEQLFAMASNGHGSREARPIQVPAEEEWATLEVSFYLRPEGGDR